MSGKSFVWLLATLLLGTVAAEAQQPKQLPRIGFVSGTGTPSNPGSGFEAFRQGLRELGYIDRKNIIIENRHGVEKVDRLPGLVTELVQLKVDVLVVAPFLAIRAAKQATKTIPIVVVTTQDPVETGFVDSLARPGGNITGITTLSRALSGKRLELLKEVVPRISRVGVIWDADTPGAAIAFKEYEMAAPSLKIQLQSLEVRGPNPDLEGAFQAAEGPHERDYPCERTFTRRLYKAPCRACNQEPIGFHARRKSVCRGRRPCILFSQRC